MEKHPPAYLSPSRLSTYAWCPAEFHRRYVLGIKDPPTPEMCFGTAVHAGLEALFHGEDDELAFLRDWRAAKATLIAAGHGVSTDLDFRGLELLQQVRNLGLNGEPERRVGVVTTNIPLPFIGYADLWDEASKTVYDFKTTGWQWTQKKADAQVFQPAIYSQAFADAYGYIPTFKFVVLTRIPGPVQVFDGTRTGQQILDAFDEAKRIYEAIEAQQFECSCGKHQEQAA